VPVFVRMIAEAALMACTPDYFLLRAVLVELGRRHPGAGSGSHETEWAPEGQPMSYPRDPSRTDATGRACQYHGTLARRRELDILDPKPRCN
jgi:hypothetical protein